jgi:hypothetical protein
MAFGHESKRLDHRQVKKAIRNAWTALVGSETTPKAAQRSQRPGNGVSGHSGSKYGNRKTNGYHSAKEASRAADLRLLELGGKIRHLKEQVRFELIPRQGDELAVRYIADFVYEEPDGEGSWGMVVEDCKGMRTAHYIIKRKLMRHVHGIVIKET